jgi:hypothetical protein
VSLGQGMQRRVDVGIIADNLISMGGLLARRAAET